MKRIAITILIFIFSFSPAVSAAAEESLEAAEKDLAAAIAEMDAISSELDRLQEMVAMPKATMLRIEIRKGSGAQVPISGRVLLQGNVEEEREWAKAERDAFAGGTPLVVLVPVLPGTYAGRVEIAHPSWKTTPGAEFQAAARKGETVLLRYLLSAVPGRSEPALSRVAEK